MSEHATIATVEPPGDGVDELGDELAQLAVDDGVRSFTDLPTDVLGHVLKYMPIENHIERAGLTCHTLCAAAKLALKVRSFSGKVVTLSVHRSVECVAVAPDGSGGSSGISFAVVSVKNCEEDRQQLRSRTSGVGDCDEKAAAPRRAAPRAPPPWPAAPAPPPPPLN